MIRNVGSVRSTFLPAMRNPLDRPEKFPERGDDDVIRLYTAIGIALTHWEIAENAFAHLFGTLVSPAKVSFPAERAYASVQSARGRKELILAAAEVFADLLDWFEEFRLYHRKDGKVVKIGDDLMSATRYGVMMLRYAELTTPPPKQRNPEHALPDAWML